MDLSILKKLGLNDKEVRVYLGLLEYGAISVRGLADVTGLNRGTVYDVLKRLQDEGLVTYYHQDTKQKFAAEDPEKLAALVHERENELRILGEKIKAAIPELKSMQDKGGSRPTTKFYEGQSGVRAILENVLEAMSGVKPADREYYVYSATKASDDLNRAYPDFTDDRIKKKTRVKAISLAEGGKGGKLAERKWLGTDRESATFILLYAGRCAFIARDLNGLPVGVIIENELIYETQKIIFMQLWSLLK